MKKRQFAARLRAQGAALDLWPAAEREAALALLARSAQARDLLADAAAAAADDAPLPDEDPVLAARLRAGVWQRLIVQFPTSAPRPRPFVFLRYGALAASFLLGAWIGLAAAPASHPAAPDLFAAAQTSPWTETLR